MRISKACVEREKSYLFWSYWFLRGLVELFDSLLIVAKIFLAANKDDGQALAEM